MKVTLEKKEKNQVELAVEIDRDLVDKAYERAYREISQHVAIPGFRKGKAPRQLIERHVGADAVRQQAVKTLANDSYDRAIAQAEVEPISQPRYEVVALQKGEPATLRYMVEVRPDVTLGGYLGIDVDVALKAITDEDIDRAVDNLRGRKGTLETVDRPVKMGDVVTVDFKGTLDGQVFEGGEATGFKLDVASGRFIPGFVEAMVDMSVGEEKDVALTMPAEYHAKELAGKETVFHLAIREIGERRLPEVTDELAKEFGAADVAALKAKIRTELEGKAEEEWEIETRKQLLEKIVEQCEMELPQSMIMREIYSLLQQHFNNLGRQGVEVGKLFSEENRQDWERQFEEEAKKRLRTSLTLGAIARKESITVTEQDMGMAISEYAQMLGRDPQELANEIVSNGGYTGMVDEVLSNNIIEWLFERANVTGRPPEADPAPALVEPTEPTAAVEPVEPTAN